MYVNIWLQLYIFWALREPIDDDDDNNNNNNDSNALVVVVVFGVMQKWK